VNPDSFPVMFPLAFDTGDLFKVLVPLIFVVMALFGKRGTQQQEEESSGTVRRVPPRQPAPTGDPSEAAAPETDLAGEMRRFLENVRQVNEQSQPPPLTNVPPPLPSRPVPVSLPPVRWRQPPALPVTVGSPAPTSPAKPAPAHEIMGGSPRSDIHEEVERSMRALSQDIETAASERVTTKSVGSVESTPLSPAPFRVDSSFLRAPSNLKQAVILIEILGKPRSLNRY